MRMPKLFPGASVALVAPSGAVPPDKLEASVEAVRAFGLKPTVYESCHSFHGNMAGTDDVRARDLMQAFLDPAIDGVLCIRGGYGAHRLMPLVDIPAMAATGKFFCGYSDITALHIALNQAGLPTWHSPMPSTEWLEGKLDAVTKAQLETALFGTQTALVPLEGKAFTKLNGGQVEGILCGGNLTLVVDSLATPWEIDTRGKVLFLEDVGEAPYRIDAMLTQLRNAGKLRDCAAILIGYWTHCEAKEGAHTLTLDQVLDELLPKDKPILSDIPCGHSLPSLCLPLGATALVDADRGAIIIEER